MLSILQYELHIEQIWKRGFLKVLPRTQKLKCEYKENHNMCINLKKYHKANKWRYSSKRVATCLNSLKQWYF